MKALVLCGGLGTRLRSVLTDIPKSMAPVGGKPFIDYVLEWLKKQRINEIILLAGYHADQIRSYIGSGQKYDLKIEYSIEPYPLSTAGAIKYASKYYELGENFLLINGDTYFDVEIEELVKFHESQSSYATIALRLETDTSRYGRVDIDDNYKITQFKEKTNSQGEGFINGGIYVLNSKILKYIPDKACSLENEIFPLLVKESQITGYPEGGYFIDIGIPTDYSKAQEVLPEWERSEKKQAAFLDRDGVIIEDSGYVHEKANLKFMPGAFDAIKWINESGKLCIVVSNQAGIAHGYYSEEEALKFEEIVEKEMKINGAKIDRFYYCPYHPQASVEKYKIDSLCRKPKPGMVLRAANDFNISLSKSFMVGDKESDRIKLPQLKSYVIKSKYVNKWDFEDLKDLIVWQRGIDIR